MSDSLKDWENDEDRVRKAILPIIKSHLDVAVKFEQLAFDLLNSIDHLRVPKVVYQVHTNLITRILHDLRVVTLIVPIGYTMQSWTVAASAFEAAYSIGFVGSDSDRAERWLEHKSLKSPPWSTYDAVESSIRYLELAEDLPEAKELAQKEYSLYKYLCMAKHVNPITERNRYWYRVDESDRLRLTPTFTRGRGLEAKLGLSLMLRSISNASWVVHKTHLPNNDVLGERLVQLAAASAALLDEWNGEPVQNAADEEP